MSPLSGPPDGIITAGELRRIEWKEPPWLIPDLLMKGTTLLFGRVKKGKSFLALQLAMSVAGGRTILGKNPQQADVLYFDLENTTRTLQENLNGLSRDWTEEERGEMDSRLHVSMDWLGFDGLAEQLERKENVRLVVVDILERVRQKEMKSGNEGSQRYSEDYSLTSPFQDISRKFDDVAILVVHHSNKYTDTFNGTSGIAGAVDNLYALKSDRGRGNASLDMEGRRIQKNDLKLRRQGPAWVLRTESNKARSDRGPTETDAQIIGLLRGSEAMDHSEIYDAYIGRGVEDSPPNKETFRKRVNRAADKGLIKREGDKFKVAEAA